MIDHFTYNAETGDLIWKAREIDGFKSLQAFNAWNTKCAGKVAGSGQYRKSGKPMAIHITFKGKGYYAHRIIWEMHNGPIPKGMGIDHINRNPLDNKLGNLRLATHAQNSHNKGANSNNTSGYKGVSFKRRTGRWMAQINIHKKQVHLGLFDTPELAYYHYCTAAYKYHGEFARTN